jgi:hypothetical protein
MMPESKRGPNKIQFVYHGMEYDVDVDAELSVDRENLAKDFMEQAGKYAFYAAAYAAAQMAVEQADLDLAIAKSQTAARLRATPLGTDSKGKPKDPSEAYIDKELPRQEEVISAQHTLIKAKAQEAHLRAIKEAFQHRRDMLIQLGYDTRVELRT